ncbi:unnamed protein product [Protopolystoma xenopodis]|uniref:EF-hand domain-containing protein n=1 Tax=Protopolystoma xenopodis TaxID=117903 RepID=A0A3S5FGI2_9PLAT|nr:unnamed protein product [Protopolystoma xenopodis]
MKPRPASCTVTSVERRRGSLPASPSLSCLSQILLAKQARIVRHFLHQSHLALLNSEGRFFRPANPLRPPMDSRDGETTNRQPLKIGPELRRGFTDQPIRHLDPKLLRHLDQTVRQLATGSSDDALVSACQTARRSHVYNPPDLTCTGFDPTQNTLPRIFSAYSRLHESAGRSTHAFFPCHNTNFSPKPKLSTPSPSPSLSLLHRCLCPYSSPRIFFYPPSTGPATPQEFITAFDTDEDGRISYDEFAAGIASLTPEILE